MRKQARLFCCISCEWMYKGDPTSCPKCGMPCYSAHYVYGKKAYRYAITQQPWKERKITDYVLKLNQEIREAGGQP